MQCNQQAIVCVVRFQSKTIAEQMAEKINAKLGYRPIVEEEKETESAAETFKRYEEELDINDFPQTARWKVTSKVRELYPRWLEKCNPILRTCLKKTPRNLFLPGGAGADM